MKRIEATRNNNEEKKKGKEIMEVKIQKNNKVEEIDKDELKTVAETLSEVEKLPTEKRIAMQYYIKGTLAGLQMMGDNTSLAGKEAQAL